ncbi:MAG: tetratricopeptide repeat protein [Hassallia sp.]
MNAEAVTTYKSAISLIQNGRIKEAILALDRAIKLENNFIDAWLAKGNILDDIGNYNAAINCFDKVLAINPNLATAWFNRAISLMNLKQYLEVIKSTDKAIEILPNYYQAWNTRASALQMIGKYNEAISSYIKAIKIKSDDCVAIENLLGLYFIIVNGDKKVLQKVSSEETKFIEKLVQKLKE